MSDGKIKEMPCGMCSLRAALVGDADGISETHVHEDRRRYKTAQADDSVELKGLREERSTDADRAREDGSAGCLLFIPFHPGDLRFPSAFDQIRPFPLSVAICARRYALGLRQIPVSDRAKHAFLQAGLSIGVSEERVVKCERRTAIQSLPELDRLSWLGVQHGGAVKLGHQDAHRLLEMAATERQRLVWETPYRHSASFAACGLKPAVKGV